MSHRFSFVLVLIVLLGGCSKPSPSTPVAAKGGTATTPADQETADLLRDKLQELAKTQGPKDGAAAAVDSANTTADEGPVDGPRTALDGVSELAFKREFTKALAMAQAAEKEDPKNRQLILAIIQLNQAIAMEKIQGGDEAAANPHFVDSAKYARRLVAEFSPIVAQERPLLANVVYNEACVFAKEKKTDAAIASLGEVLGYGFDDLTQLDQDKDFDSIREEEAFKKWRESAGEQVADNLKKKALEAQQKTLDELAANKPFDFDFTLNDPAGKTLKLADLKGKIVLVDVWGTWCPPCRLEIPHLVAVHKKYAEKGVEVVGLNYEGGTPEEDAAKITDFVKKNGVTYPCLLGDDATKDQIPNFEGFPTMLFIDRAGKVRLKHVGYTPQAGLEVVIEALLAEQPEEK